MATVYHPAFGQALRYRLDEVSDDPDEQVAQTINFMSGYVIEDWNSPEIARDAEEALLQNPDVSPIEAVFRYVKSRVRFTQDAQLSAPLQDHYRHPIVETLIRPRDLAVLCDSAACQRQGDCDDFTMYTAALLHAVGVSDVRFATVAADPSHPNEFSHVYVVAYQDGQRIPLDTSHGPRAGWETEQIYAPRKEWRIGAGSLLPLLALALLIGVFLCH